jgi:very-short-patch-repair endonuclease
MDAYLWDSQGIIHFTPIEAWLWHDIRAVDAVLYPQYPVGRFFVDFANPVAKVAIECDGAAYHDQARDAERDAQLQRMGWTVYRFPGWMCRQDFDEQTRKSSECYLRMQDLSELHGIDRKSREKSGEWSQMGELTSEIFNSLRRERAILSAAAVAKR